jgi:hypothetical protein
MSGYWSGRSVTDGRVRLLAAKTFRELVESQVFVPVAFPMTRPDFLAHPDRDRLKDGAFLVASTYDGDEARRANENATGFNLVIIDLDGPEARDFAESPDTIADALGNLNFVAWTTAKHTPEAPRIKIMVDCVTSEPRFFKPTASHVTKLLGLPPTFKGSPESKTLSLPQYRPLQFQGEEYSAVIGSRLDGKPLDPATVPDEDLAPEPGYAYTPTDADLSGVLGDLRFIPIQGITLEDIREPLYAIDPDHSYQRWYHIAAALRHNFPDEDEAREAFTFYDEWSSQGGKYRGADETLAKWRSFRPYPYGRNPITLRSLFSYAIESGWNHSKLTTRISDDFSSWCQQANSADLMGEGVRRIAVMPVRSDMGDELMADHIVKNMKRCGSTITKQAVLKDVRMHRRVDRAEKAKESKPSWMMPFCFIGPQDRFRNILTGVEYSVEAFNHSFSRHMIAPDEPTADGKAVMLPANYALNVGDIVIVDGAIYDPRQESGSEPYFTIEGQRYVNTFRESSVPAASPIGAKRAGNLVKKLLRANLGNEDYERTVLDWLAFCVQKPGEKIRWSILMQGGQGCGKGTLIDTVGAAIGRANIKVISGDILGSSFNDWREGAHFVYCDELFSAGANRHELNNKMKDAITNTWVPVNRKFKDVMNIPNVSNYFLSTNKHDALVLEDSDRRYMVLKSKLQTKTQIAVFTAEGVMSRIHELIEENPGAFRHFFLNHEISADFNPSGHAPDTVFRQELVEQGKNIMQVTIEDMIENDEHPLIGDDVIHYAYLERTTAMLSKNSARPSHYLHSLGYRAWQDGKTLRVNGERTKVFVHCDRFVEGLEDPVEVLESRAEFLME